MSLIVTQGGREGWAWIACPLCSALVGEFTFAEIGDLTRAGIEPYCFDCDPTGVDGPPKQLVLNDDHYLLGIGSAIFLAEHTGDHYNWRNYELCLHRISHTTFFDLKTGLGTRYTSLSSMPNLHNQNPKLPENSREGEIHANAT